VSPARQLGVKLGRGPHRALKLAHFQTLLWVYFLERLFVLRTVTVSNHAASIPETLKTLRCLESNSDYHGAQTGSDSTQTNLGVIGERYIRTYEDGQLLPVCSSRQFDLRTKI
jgi:hypothetical protein